MFSGTSSFRWLHPQGGGSPAQPEVCVRCGSLQQQSRASGQRYRGDKCTCAGIYACPTSSNVGSLGSGLLHKKSKLKVKQRKSRVRHVRGASVGWFFPRWHFKQSSIPSLKRPAVNCGVITQTQTQLTAHRKDLLWEGEAESTIHTDQIAFCPFWFITFFFFNSPFYRLHMATLQHSSPHLCQLFLTSVFLETEINIQQESLHSCSSSGKFAWDQVKKQQLQSSGDCVVNVIFPGATAGFGCDICSLLV